LLGFVIIALRIVGLVKLQMLDFSLKQTQYLPMQLISQIVVSEQSLMSPFIVLVFLRSLKFLRILNSTGVTSKSVLDTLQHKSF